MAILLPSAITGLLFTAIPVCAQNLATTASNAVEGGRTALSGAPSNDMSQWRDALAACFQSRQFDRNMLQNILPAFRGTSSKMLVEYAQHSKAFDPILDKLLRSKKITIQNVKDNPRIFFSVLDEVMGDQEKERAKLIRAATSAKTSSTILPSVIRRLREEKIEDVVLFKDGDAAAVEDAIQIASLRLSTPRDQLLPKTRRTARELAEGTERSMVGETTPPTDGSSKSQPKKWKSLLQPSPQSLSGLNIPRLLAPKQKMGYHPPAFEAVPLPDPLTAEEVKITYKFLNYKKTIDLFNAQGALIHRIRTSDRFASALVTRDGKYLATESYNGLVQLWSVATGYEVLRSYWLPGTVKLLAENPEGDQIFIVTYDDSIYEWRKATGYPVPTGAKWLSEEKLQEINEKIFAATSRLGPPSQAPGGQSDIAVEEKTSANRSDLDKLFLPVGHSRLSEPTEPGRNSLWAVMLKVLILTPVPLVGETAVHEFGHYLMAKLLRVPVYEIKLFYFIITKLDETHNLIESGGYVKHGGTTPRQRLPIALAGPIFSWMYNLAVLSAAILFLIKLHAIASSYGFWLTMLSGSWILNSAFLNLISIFMNFPTHDFRIVRSMLAQLRSEKTVL